MPQVDIASLYSRLQVRLAEARKSLGHPLTLTEKILCSHLAEGQEMKFERGKSFLLLHPDRVAMQDATAQMALLQFMQANKPTVALPSTVHCDHLILSCEGATEDLRQANRANREVYDFLSSASSKYGIGFWKPGSGIIHQIVLENYAFPGGLMIGTDSHTPNAGGLGMMAVGVGGADAVDAMVGMPWELLCPKVIGVNLTGRLQGWSSGKDIILKLLSILTVKGGTNCVLEYFGPGVETLSATAQATVANMGAETGATCSLFPWHESMGEYLRQTRRAEVAEEASRHAADLGPDAGAVYDRIIEIDLSTLEPMIAGPHTPDLVRPLSAFAAEIREKRYPDKVSASLIGSCTNSSYEDLGRTASVLAQAVVKGGKSKIPLLVTPGSAQVQATTTREGHLETIRRAGGQLMANACGPCIGQWKRTDMEKGTPNSIVTTYNRNFPARNDGNPETLAFIVSPEMAAAYALSGSLSFDPRSDQMEGPDGVKFKLAPPQGEALPAGGFAFDDSGFTEPAADGSQVPVAIAPASDRLQILAPFSPWGGDDLIGLPVLAKVKGKCTTDHISPAGKWLKFRGHLQNISENMLTGAINAFTGETGLGRNILTSMAGLPYSRIAMEYRSQGLGWVIIGDENYGEAPRANMPP